MKAVILAGGLGAGEVHFTLKPNYFKQEKLISLLVSAQFPLAEVL